MDPEHIPELVSDARQGDTYRFCKAFKSFTEVRHAHICFDVPIKLPMAPAARPQAAFFQNGKAVRIEKSEDMTRLLHPLLA